MQLDTIKVSITQRKDADSIDFIRVVFKDVKSLRVSSVNEREVGDDEFSMTDFYVNRPSDTAIYSELLKLNDTLMVFDFKDL
jgi:hypothetical protein